MRRAVAAVRANSTSPPTSRSRRCTGRSRSPSSLWKMATSELRLYCPPACTGTEGGFSTTSRSPSSSSTMSRARTCSVGGSWRCVGCETTSPCSSTSSGAHAAPFTRMQPARIAPSVS